MTILRMAFERAHQLDPRNVAALVGLSILEFNSKEVDNLCNKSAAIAHHLCSFMFNGG